EVARDGGLRQVEVADDLPHRALVVLQQPQDFLAGAVRQRLEDLRQLPLASEFRDATIEVGHDLLLRWVWNRAPLVWIHCRRRRLEHDCTLRAKHPSVLPKY